MFPPVSTLGSVGRVVSTGGFVVVEGFSVGTLGSGVDGGCAGTDERGVCEGVVGGTLGSTEGAVGGTLGSTEGVVGGTLGSTEGVVGGTLGSTEGVVGGTLGSTEGVVGGTLGSTEGVVGGTLGSTEGVVGGTLGSTEGVVGGTLGSTEGVVGGTLGSTEGVVGGTLGSTEGVVGGTLGSTEGPGPEGAEVDGWTGELDGAVSSTTVVLGAIAVVDDDSISTLLDGRVTSGREVDGETSGTMIVLLLPEPSIMSPPEPLSSAPLEYLPTVGGNKMLAVIIAEGLQEKYRPKSKSVTKPCKKSTCQLT